MKDFIKVQFKGHTAMIQEMSFFTLMDRVSSEEVESLKRTQHTFMESVNKRLKKIESDVEELQRYRKADKEAHNLQANKLKQHIDNKTVHK